MNLQIKAFLTHIFCFTLCLPTLLHIASAQNCPGSWALQRILTVPCLSGQWIGWQNINDPVGCPNNPTYIGTQTNTFTFTAPVSQFAIGFVGLDGSVLCPRIEIKVNGIFYAVNDTNLTDLVSGTPCSLTSFSYLSVTSDGYITESALGGPGKVAQGTLFIDNVNATTVTISSNDAFGTSFSNPFNCLAIVPLKLESFSGYSADCDMILTWKTGTEYNIKNIEVEKSEVGAVFYKTGEVIPKGSNSHYSFITTNVTDTYFRLKINDLDGNYKYSKIIKVKSSCSTSAYQITPNPAYSSVKISNLKKDDGILILDMSGRRIINFIIQQDNDNIDIHKLLPGMYLLRVIKAGNIKANLKFIHY